MVPQLPCKRMPMSCLRAPLVTDGNLMAGKDDVAVNNRHCDELGDIYYIPNFSWKTSGISGRLGYDTYSTVCS